MSKNRVSNPGGRPKVGAGQRQKYVVSTRLSLLEYLHLKTLVRQSGKKPAQIIRELLNTG